MLKDNHQTSTYVSVHTVENPGGVAQNFAKTLGAGAYLFGQSLKGVQYFVNYLPWVGGGGGSMLKSLTPPLCSFISEMTSL